MNVETYNPVTLIQRHIVMSPTDCSTSAMDAPRRDPNRSGRRAPKIRTDEHGERVLGEHETRPAQAEVGDVQRNERGESCVAGRGRA